MYKEEEIVVELNGQQLKLLKSLQSAVSHGLDPAELIRMGFNEWAKLKRAGKV